MSTTTLHDARGWRLSDAPAWVHHVGFALLFFGAWELYGHTGNALILPPVSEVLQAFWHLIATGELPRALLSSIQLLVYGFAVALLSGFVLGVVAGRYKTVDRTFRPFLDALYATPIIALVPLVLVWFGFGLQGRVIVVFLAAFFPILINVYAGVRDAPQDLIDVARSFGVTGELGLLRKVILPAAVPFIMAGVRLGIGRGVVGMAVAEVYLRLGGIGALIVEYGAVFRTDMLIAAILPLPVLGIGLTKLFAAVESRFQDWKTI